MLHNEVEISESGERPAVSLEKALVLGALFMLALIAMSVVVLSHVPVWD